MASFSIPGSPASVPAAGQPPPCKRARGPSTKLPQKAWLPLALWHLGLQLARSGHTRGRPRDRDGSHGRRTTTILVGTVPHGRRTTTILVGTVPRKGLRRRPLSVLIIKDIEVTLPGARDQIMRDHATDPACAGGLCRSVAIPRHGGNVPRKGLRQRPLHAFIIKPIEVAMPATRDWILRDAVASPPLGLRT